MRLLSWPLSFAAAQRLDSHVNPQQVRYENQTGTDVNHDLRPTASAGCFSVLFIVGASRPSFESTDSRTASDQNSRGLQFNAPHWESLALTALTAGRPIGVDVERVRSDLDIDGIAGRFFSSREQADLAPLTATERCIAFFRCWSGKEAFIKARGEGLSLPLDRFDVTPAPGEPAAPMATRPDPHEAGRWAIWDVA